MEKKDGHFCKENFRVRISAMYLYSVEKQLLTNYMYTEERGNLLVQQGRGIWEAGLEKTSWIISAQ